MTTVERNPTGVDTAYLKGLNACFPGWGDEPMFDWAFRRQVSGPAADMLVIRQGGDLIAGSAVTYRRLRSARGTEALTALMTGSWTTPAARGHGCFTQLIEASVEVARERGAVLLLAFVTATNASFRRLEAAGAQLFPTRYLFSTAETRRCVPVGGTPRVIAGLRRGSPQLEALFLDFEQRRPPGTCFVYANADEWASQFLERPSLAQVVEVPGLGFGIVEEHRDTDRLQGIAAELGTGPEHLTQALLARAQAHGRKFFSFSMEPSPATHGATQLGLGVAQGHLTAIAVSPTATRVFLGDSEPNGSRDVATTALQALAPWSVHSGDRM
jgi:ribosomal protein S18 acetylase RimI-like enzyme